MRREPHVRIGEAEVVAHLQQDHAGDRIDLGRELRLALEPLHLAHRHVDGEIDLARLHRGDARGRVLDDVEGDALDLRLRPPIAVVALQHDARVELVFDELVGPGADRLLAERLDADLLHVVLRHHVAAEEGEPLRRGRRRRVELHHRLRGRSDLDVGHLAPRIRGVDLVAGLDALEERVPEILGASSCRRCGT